MADSLIGQNVLKTEGVDKATGKAKYAADCVLPGLLEGKVLRSPFPHARILRIDTTKAERLPGVYAVATAKDATPNLFGQFFKDRTIFAVDKVRFIGDPVAAVAASDEETAEEALRLIAVEYQELPAVFDPLEAMKAGAPIIHDNLASYQDMGPSVRYGNVRNEVRIQRGDVEVGFAEADLIVEERFSTQAAHQGYIEPRACVASVDHTGKVTVWCSTKAPFRVRGNLADGLGLPLSKIRVIAPALGGDFGGKGSATVEPIAAVLSRKTDRPVRIAVTRDEEMAFNFTRHAAYTQLKVGAKRDGTLVAVQGRVIFDSGGYSGGINGLAHTCFNLTGSYRVPHVALTGLSVYTNNVPGGQVRAPGAPQTFWALEQVIDEIARRLNLDPWEVRLKNALVEGDRSPTGKAILRNVAAVATLNKCAELAQQQLSRGKNRGIGVALGDWHLESELGTASSASIKLNEDGTAVLWTGVTDNGAGQYTLMAQIAAEVLGLTPEDISVVAADTDLTPYESGTGGSNTTYRVGNTVKQAAEHARQQLLQLAAERLEANTDDLEVVEKEVRVKGSPERSLSIAALANAALTSKGGPVIGTNAPQRQRWLEALGEAHGTIDAPVCCAAAAEVEVDPETGNLRVVKYVAAQDVGYALNPRNVTGQIEGSVHNGLGYALTEEFKYANGKALNPNFLDYKMFTAADMPPIYPVLVEELSDFGPFGAKGVGEPAITIVAAAVANAVRDAVGVRIKDAPVTAEKIVTALREREKARAS